MKPPNRGRAGTTDAHAQRMIQAGRILCDPTTGVILVDGKPNGTTDKASGYNRTHCAGVYMPAHRVMWIFVHGSIPTGHVINHRDGNRRNNRIENLEAVTPRENALHARRSPNYRGEYPDALAPDLSDVREPVEHLTETERLMQRDDVSRSVRRIA